METIFVYLLIVLLVISCGAHESLLSREKRFLIVPPTSPTRHQLISGIGIPLDLEDEAVTLGIVLKAQYFLPENADQLKPIYFPGIFNNFSPVNFVETQQLEFPNGKRRKREIIYDEISGQKIETYDEEAEELSNSALKNEQTEYENEDDEEEYEYDDEFSEDSGTTKREDFPRPTEEEEHDTRASRWLVYDGFAKLLDTKGFSGRACVLRGICESAETKFTHHSGLFGELLHIVFT